MAFINGCTAQQSSHAVSKIIYRAKQAELFLETLKRLPEQAKLESTELFMSLVDKVIVGDGLTFIMRDGTERTVNGVR